jgi:hypothetical protein
VAHLAPVSKVVDGQRVRLAVLSIVPADELDIGSVDVQAPRILLRVGMHTPVLGSKCIVGCIFVACCRLIAADQVLNAAQSSATMCPVQHDSPAVTMLAPGSRRCMRQANPEVPIDLLPGWTPSHSSGISNTRFVMAPGV